MGEYYILDSSVVVGHPLALAAASDSGHQVLLPAVAFGNALKSRTFPFSWKLRRRLVKVAMKLGMEFLPPPTEGEMKVLLREFPQLAAIDDHSRLLMATVFRYWRACPEDNQMSVWFVSDDPLLSDIAHRAEMQVLGSRQFLQERGIAKGDSELVSIAARVARVAVIELLLNGAAGVALAAIAVSAAWWGPTTLRTLPAWGSVLLLLVLGVVMYWTRSRHRLSYGVGELVIGLAISTRQLWPALRSSTFDVGGLLQVAAGLYVIVRGLDNIGIGLRGSRLEFAWRGVFGE